MAKNITHYSSNMFKIEHIQRQKTGADKQGDGVSSSIRKVHQTKDSFLQQKNFV